MAATGNDVNKDLPDNVPTPPKKEKSKKKGKGKLIFFLCFLLIVGGCAAVIYFDIGGLRENIIMPYLRNAPVIGGFLPQPEPEVEEISAEELTRRLTVITTQLESVQAQLAIALEQLSLSEARVEHLTAFEQAWHLYREARNTFDQMVAHSAPHDFVQFFHHISQENEVVLFLEAMQIAEFLDETREIVNTLNNMDESGAGEVLQNLMTADTALMVRALRMMSPVRRAEILDTLESSVVTNMLILMAPDEPAFPPLLPPELPPVPPVPGVVIEPAVPEEEEDGEPEEETEEETDEEAEENETEEDE